MNASDKTVAELRHVKSHGALSVEIKAMSSNAKFKIVSISGARIGYGESIAGPEGVPHTLKFYFEPTIEVQCKLDSSDEETLLEELYEYLHTRVKGAVKKRITADRQAAAQKE